MAYVEIKWDGREDEFLDILREYEYDEVEVDSIESMNGILWITLYSRLSRAELEDLVEGAALMEGLVEIMDEFGFVHNWSYR
tara:strand:- start:470 stop:715 length:246 start_codon:yes stop_codon:yes gene_type:complete